MEEIEGFDRGERDKNLGKWRGKKIKRRLKKLKRANNFFKRRFNFFKRRFNFKKWCLFSTKKPYFLGKQGSKRVYKVYKMIL
ncbi:MAG: hypothetical protein MJZ71_03455 [Bacteroidales bacterium]|nr:hypothetical protein [Bacteroidales bacterium]